MNRSLGFIASIPLRRSKKLGGGTNEEEGGGNEVEKEGGIEERMEDIEEGINLNSFQS